MVDDSLRDDSEAPGSELSVSEIVSELRALLGAKLAAYIAGVGDTRTVRAWADGTLAPSTYEEEVLRAAHHIAEIVKRGGSREVVPTWFQGMNPSLGDASPARMLHESGRKQAPLVLEAAKEFLQH